MAKIHFRASAAYDKDLLMLAAQKDFNFSAFCEQALEHFFVKKETFLVELKNYKEVDLKNLEGKDFPISISEEVAGYLRFVKSYMRNAFIKQILRQCFFISDYSNFFEEGFEHCTWERTKTNDTVEIPTGKRKSQSAIMLETEENIDKKEKTEEKIQTTNIPDEEKTNLEPREAEPKKEILEPEEAVTPEAESVTKEKALSFQSSSTDKQEEPELPTTEKWDIVRPSESEDEGEGEDVGIIFREMMGMQ